MSPEMQQAMPQAEPTPHPAQQRAPVMAQPRMPIAAPALPTSQDRRADDMGADNQRANHHGSDGSAPVTALAPAPMSSVAPPVCARADLILVEKVEPDLAGPTPTKAHPRVHSRSQSPSLADRFHFATLSLKHRFHREARWIDQFASNTPARSRKANTKRPNRSPQRAFIPPMERPGIGIAKP